MMKRKIPRFLIWTGIPFAIAGAILATRLVAEQTIMSWRGGPQFIGGSAHSLADLGLILLVLAGLLWVLVFAIYAVLRRTLGGRLGVCVIAIYLASVAICRVPYATWQRIFADRIAAGGHAGDFMTRAAAYGDVETLRALIDAGVGVDTLSESGSSALCIAAEEGQLEAAEYLLARGADINGADGCSPLAHAESYEIRRKKEVAQLLRTRGAHQAEQTVPSDGHKPSSRVPSDSSTAPADAH
jgi:hypothetical protein